MIAAFRKELRPTVRLAAPLAMAELGWMIMGFVDTVMAGRIDAAKKQLAGCLDVHVGDLGDEHGFPSVILSEAKDLITISTRTGASGKRSFAALRMTRSRSRSDSAAPC